MNHLLYEYFSNDSPCNISKCNFVIFFIPKGGDIWVFFVEKQFLFNILVSLDMSKCFLFWFILPMVLDARKSVLCVCKIIAQINLYIRFAFWKVDIHCLKQSIYTGLGTQQSF